MGFNQPMKNNSALTIKLYYNLHRLLMTGCTEQNLNCKLRLFTANYYQSHKT